MGSECLVSFGEIKDLNVREKKGFKCQSEYAGLRCFRVFTAAERSFQEQQTRGRVYVGTFSETQLRLQIRSLCPLCISLCCPTKAKHSNYTKTKTEYSELLSRAKLIYLRTDHSLRDPIQS